MGISSVVIGLLLVAAATSDKLNKFSEVFGGYLPPSNAYKPPSTSYNDPSIGLNLPGDKQKSSEDINDPYSKFESFKIQYEANKVKQTYSPAANYESKEGGSYEETTSIEQTYIVPQNEESSEEEKPTPDQPTGLYEVPENKFPSPQHSNTHSEETSAEIKQSEETSAEIKQSEETYVAPTQDISEEKEKPKQIYAEPSSESVEQENQDLTGLYETPSYGHPKTHDEEVPKSVYFKVPKATYNVPKITNHKTQKNFEVPFVYEALKETHSREQSEEASLEGKEQSYEEPKNNYVATTTQKTVYKQTTQRPYNSPRPSYHTPTKTPKGKVSVSHSFFKIPKTVSTKTSDRYTAPTISYRDPVNTYKAPERTYKSPESKQVYKAPVSKQTYTVKEKTLPNQVYKEPSAVNKETYKATSTKGTEPQSSEEENNKSIEQVYRAPKPQQSYDVPERAYKTPEPKQTYKAPEPKQTYKAPEPKQTYRAPEPKQTYKAPEPKQTYRAPEPKQTYKAPEPKQTYRAPKPKQTYKAPEPKQTYKAPEPKQTYKAPEPKQTYRAPEAKQKHEAPEPKQTYRAPEPKQIYKAPESKPTYKAPEPKQTYEAPSTKDSGTHSFFKVQNVKYQQNDDQQSSEEENNKFTKQVYSAPKPQQSYNVPEKTYKTPEFKQPYKAPVPKQTNKAPESKQTYRAPEPKQTYRAPESKQTYKAPEHKQAYKAPKPKQTYEAPSTKDAGTHSFFKIQNVKYQQKDEHYQSGEEVNNKFTKQVYRAPKPQPSYNVPSKTYKHPEPKQTYKAPEPKQTYKAPEPKQTYKSPEPKQTYKSPELKQTYKAPEPKQTYKAPSTKGYETHSFFKIQNVKYQENEKHHQSSEVENSKSTNQGYRDVKPQQSYNAPSKTYKSPEPKQTYTAPEPKQTYKAPEPKQTYKAPEPKQTYKAPEPKQTYKAPEPKQTYKAPDPKQTYKAPEPKQTYKAPEPEQTYKVPQAIFIKEIPQQTYQEPAKSYGASNHQSKSQLSTEDSEKENVYPPKMMKAMPFEFEYKVDDDKSGNHYGHQADSDGMILNGVYYVDLPDGRRQVVTYLADWDTGYHADITYEKQ